MVVARLQQLMVLAVLGFAGTWLAMGVLAGPTGFWAWWLMPVLLLPHAPVLALEFVLLDVFGRDPAAPPARALDLVRAWWGEVWCSLRVFAWRQPFRHRRWPDQPGRPGHRGVVLVHGFFCNRGLWAPWLKRFTAAGVPYTALSLRSAFGAIDGHAATLEAAVQDMAKRTGMAPVVVAHSMGGLVVRSWLASAAHQQREPTGPWPLHAVVTVGTPHQGTWLARFAYAANGRQMRMANPWLTALADREERRRAAAGWSPAGERFICFFGHADNIVFPASHGMLKGADNRHLPAVAHVQMLFHPEVWAAVMGLLQQPVAAAPRA